MTRPFGSLTLLIALAWAAAAPADDSVGPFQGEWRTTIGLVNLVQKGNEVTGTYGNSQQFTIKGSTQGRLLAFDYQEGARKGNGRFLLDGSGHAFTGQFQIQGGRAGVWNGWQPDPAALKAERARFDGLWLTDFGLMELTQEGGRVAGRYATRGTSEITGDVTGRRLDFHFQSHRRGSGWFEQAEGGRSLAGAARGDGFAGWFAWQGRLAPEFVRHPRLIPGQIVDGSTRNLLTYAARAPEGYQESSTRKWPTVVILHGSNMNARSYLSTMALVWPDIARDFLLIGINGEAASDTGKEPRFNYTYLNTAGKSTFKGLPGTDRESPALVSEALGELRAIYPVDHYLVGGHSQGGFLTYCLLMNDPGSIAGVFPTSAGVIVQCEPDAFTDEALRKAQRAVSLVIVHGRTDPLVSFASGEHAATLFGESGWPAFRFLADSKGAHMFARLPIGPAVRWLEALSSRDPTTLLEFAEAREREGGHRDAIAALRRVRTLELSPKHKSQADSLARTLEEKAAAGALDLLPRVKTNANGSWVDAFLAYRDDFEFADSAREIMTAFESLRARHTPLARAALDEARTAFRSGKKDDGLAKYREILAKHYASPSYRNVKRWLAERQ